MNKKFIFAVCLIISLSLFCSETQAKKTKKKGHSPSASSSESSEIFGGISKAEHIFGPEVTQADLKGKVVFLEYWGINCPPCRASYPHLVELQEKYAKTGKFTVLASHRQGFSNQVKPFLEKQKVTFPVYQFFNEPKAPSTGGVPHAALIDHTGKVVATGYPSDLYSKVASLVKATPHPILGGVEVKSCKSQAKALSSGKGLTNAIKSLEKISATEGEKGEEAKALLDAADKYLEKKKEKLLSEASTTPSSALGKMIIYAKSVHGLKYEKEIAAKLIELKKDSSLKKLMNYRKEIEKFNAKLAKRDSSSTRKALEKVKANVQKLIDNKSTTPSVANEAKTLL